MHVTMEETEVSKRAHTHTHTHTHNCMGVVFLAISIQLSRHAAWCNATERTKQPGGGVICKLRWQIAEGNSESTSF